MRPEDKLLDILINRQDAIFNKLEEMDGTLKTVAVQKNEIDHLNVDMMEVKQVQGEHGRRLTAAENRIAAAENACTLNHPKDEKPSLGKRVVHTIVLTAVSAATLFILGLVGFIAFSSLPGYLDFNRTQVSAEPAKKVR